MKKFVLQFLVTLTILTVTINNSFASHFAGADLTYKCLGGNDYLITLSFYRDCSGVTMSGYMPATVNFSCTSNSAFNFSASLPAIAGTGNEVTPGCSAIPTKCSNGSNYGVQEYVMQAQVTLAPCNQWVMSYTGGSRNPVTTVNNNGSNNWYVTAMLNNLQAPCNSSPTFSNKPIGVACLNQLSCFNHGAIDINGDSLAYSFYSPFTNSATTTVTYNWPYTYTSFLQSSTPITIDPITGDICYTPTASLVTLTGVKVMEYRKINNVYVLIGTVYRDLQLKIDQCINTLPKISGMDTLNSHTYKTSDSTYWLETCYIPGKVISFDINGFDADTFNSTVLGNPEKFAITWNNGIPQGSFQSFYNNTDSAYAHFSWALQTSDISNLPKCFTATIKDQACPYFGSQTYSYCITVRGMTVKIGTDTLLCSGESVQYTAIADTTTKNYIWTVNGVGTGTPLIQDHYTFNSIGKAPGLYTIGIETNDGGTTVKCPGKDFAIVNLVYQPHINGTLHDTSFCKPGTAMYDAGQGGMYIWTDSMTNPVSSSQTFSPNSTGKYIVVVDGGNGTRCMDIDTFEVFAIENPDLGPDICIWNTQLAYKLEPTKDADPGLVYLWSNNQTTKSIDITTSGKYTLSVYHPSINSSLKCSDDAVVNILDENTFIQSAKIQAEQDITTETYKTSDRTICSHQKLKIIGPEAPAGHSYNYTWTMNGNTVSNTPYYILKEKTPGVNVVELLVAPGCKADINVTVEYCAVTPPNVITPNGDNFNEKFVIDGLENFPNSTLLIYNRWGIKVFESNNYSNDWDGENYADGIYYWVLRVTDGENTEYQGTLTVMRK